MPCQLHPELPGRGGERLQQQQQLLLLHPHHQRCPGHRGLLLAADSDGAAGGHEGVPAPEDARQGRADNPSQNT